MGGVSKTKQLSRIKKLNKKVTHVQLIFLESIIITCYYYIDREIIKNLRSLRNIRIIKKLFCLKKRVRSNVPPSSTTPVVIDSRK